MNRILVTLFQSKPHEEVTIVLLYRQYVRRYPQTVEILHSTMLLLYPAAAFAAAIVAYLHSTMLLLYLNQSLYTFPYILKFTFHSASTLSTVSYRLYLLRSNLHSTMLLLYLQGIVRLRQDSRIYIPLCFYFIGLDRI